ncbi:MAG: 50S ribosomal protein L6 [Candidatus Levybacteria bacterium RIFCSPLOWO2_01_FULL_37_20]|nr:MAG: 50S ribosomal protein L6 [Candidatus Levybacteria bacterium RIFCSPLOWO2_01_FULL_37_20]
MSRIGRIPVVIPNGTTVVIENRTIKINGPKGELLFVLPGGIEVRIEDKNVVIFPKGELTQDLKPLFGLTRATIANMIQGVTKGFEKKLELSGVGYRAQVNGNDLVISVGFSHPVTVRAKKGISFSVFENVITVLGIDNTIVGDVASRIRAIRPPEPYKGKGIRYVGERIRRKAGKAAKAVGAK